MAPAVVQFEWMPEAFEETGAEVLTELAQRRRQPSHHRNIFPLKEARRRRRLAPAFLECNLAPPIT